MTEKRRRRDVTLSFDRNDEVYWICKELGPTGIKELINVHYYQDLVEKAKAEQRSLSNFIKHKLKSAIDNDKKNTIG